jgi:predicted regulator of Ras-like GTPase activity (Roadblock/LC7/MglB family)
MASSLIALGQSVLRELAAGALDHVVVEGAEGKLVVCSVPGANSPLLLAVLAQSDARLGLVLGHAKACARQVAEFLPR